MALSDEAGAGVGAAVSVGSAAAQGGMNPIADLQAGLAIVGLGMSIFGTSKQVSATKQMGVVAQNQANASMEIANLDKQVNEQRRQQMVLTAQRQQLQTIRYSQLARSMALTSATSQGAQFGSGLQGGYGQISGDKNTNLLGVNQNLEIGQNIFNLDNLMDDQKIKLAQYGADMAKLQGKSSTGAGLSSLGSSVGKAAGPLGSLLGGFGAGPSFSGDMSQGYSEDSSSLAQSSMGGGFGGGNFK